MTKRIIYIDYLRILSIFAVIIIHVSAENWYANTIDTNWIINNIINSIVCWAVSLFVVISGSLHLNQKEITFKTLVYKILRILLCLIIWHTIYYFWVNPEISIDNFLSCLKKLILGESYSHLWFLYLIIGLYIITPILNKLVKVLNKKELFYLLIFGFSLTSLFPTLSVFTSFDFSRIIVPFRVLNFNVFIFYYLLGYYLSKYKVHKPKLLLIISLFLLVVLGVVSGYISYNINIPFTFANNNSVFTLFAVIAIYAFFKKIKFKFNKKIIMISKLTLGIYLIHFLIEKILLKNGINAYIMNPILGNFFVSLLIFVISFCICFIISKIPILKKIIS